METSPSTYSSAAMGLTAQAVCKQLLQPRGYRPTKGLRTSSEELQSQQVRAKGTENKSARDQHWRWDMDKTGVMGNQMTTPLSLGNKNFILCFSSRSQFQGVLFSDSGFGRRTGWPHCACAAVPDDTAKQRQRSPLPGVPAQNPFVLHVSLILASQCLFMGPWASHLIVQFTYPMKTEILTSLHGHLEGSSKIKHYSSL